MRDYSNSIRKIERFDGAVRRWNWVTTYLVAFFGACLGIWVGSSFMIAGLSIASIPAGLRTGQVVGSSPRRRFQTVVRVAAGRGRAFWILLTAGAAAGAALSAWVWTSWATAVFALPLFLFEVVLGIRLVHDAGMQAPESHRAPEPARRILE
jgi:hypothetical protein